MFVRNDIKADITRRGMTLKQAYEAIKPKVLERYSEFYFTEQSRALHGHESPKSELIRELLRELTWTR